MASKYLTRNMGSLDRALRAFVIAPVAVATALALAVPAIAAIVLFVVAGIALATAATGVCPTYVLLRIDTRGGREVLPHRS
jgi:hypothetical protein